MKCFGLIGAMLCGLMCSLFAFPSTSCAGLTVASLFTDHAVLQRDAAIPVWGTADPGQMVTVEFAGQKENAVSDADGKWRVDLAAMDGDATPQVLKISDSTSQLSFSDVVIGEVWICSGQSNMQMGVNSVPDVKALVDRSNNIRSFAVKRTVAFDPQATCEGQWKAEHPDSAVAFAFAHFLQQTSEVPVGIILTCWGSSSIEAWMPREMTETVPHFKTLMDEFDSDSETRERIDSILSGDKPWSRPDDIFLRRQSNILYNAMIHPLIPYACRGLVWYQGERNTQSMFGMLKEPWYSRNSGMLKYGATLQQWILRYRKEWGNDQMQFMTVMLPGFFKPLPTGPQKGPFDPTTHSWSWMRQSQLESLEIPHTSVANTIDLGDVKNIHPRDKLPIGRRLALLAARNTLGKDVTAIGPILDRVQAQAGKLVVHFDQADGLKTVDGESPKGFWLAEDATRWVKGDAVIDGTAVVLSSSEMANPRYVRYAFAGKPEVNLVNAAGLPAYPFRTDSFAP